MFRTEDAGFILRSTRISEALGILGSGNLEGGGFGERVRKGRSVYKQPETEVDGSCHS
jgi:hypothetical protein